MTDKYQRYTQWKIGGRWIEDSPKIDKKGMLERLVGMKF